jgi:hypothetical protein
MSQISNDDTKTDYVMFTPSRRPTVVVVLAFILLGLGGWIMYERAIGLKNETQRGIEGDFVAGYAGTITAFFSALLFYAGYLKQSDELRLQRLEFRQSREVAKDQERQLERQVEKLEEQLRETRLNNDRSHLLEMISDIRSTIVSCQNQSHNIEGCHWDRCLPGLEYACIFAKQVGDKHRSMDEFHAIIKTIPHLIHLHDKNDSPFSTTEAGKNLLSRNKREHPNVFQFLVAELKVNYPDIRS